MVLESSNEVGSATLREATAFDRAEVAWLRVLKANMHKDTGIPVKGQTYRQTDRRVLTQNTGSSIQGGIERVYLKGIVPRKSFMRVSLPKTSSGVATSSPPSAK